VRYAGPAPEQREDVAQVVGEQIRHVEEPEARRAPADLRDAGFRSFLPVLRGCVPVAEIRHKGVRFEFLLAILRVRSEIRT
jgi:hypothetical protein